MSDRDNHSNRGRGKNRGSRGGSGGHNQGGRGGNKNKNNNKDRNHKPQGYSKQDKSKHNQQHRKKNYHENFPKVCLLSHHVSILFVTHSSQQQDNGPFKLRVTNAPHQVTTTDEVRAFLSTQSALPINSIEQVLLLPRGVLFHFHHTLTFNTHTFLSLEALSLSLEILAKNCSLPLETSIVRCFCQGL